MTEPPNEPPAFSESEEQSSEELLRNMGHAMTAWQGVEHAVFDVYRFFFDDDHGDAAAVAYFAVRTFDARTQMADELVAHFLNEDQRDKWTCLRTKIRKRSQRRNEAAHGLFSFYGKAPKRKALISRSVYDIRSFPEKPRDFHFTSAKEMLEGAEASAILAKDIYDFLAELQRDGALRPKFRERPQRVEVNALNNPLTGHIPPKP